MLIIENVLCMRFSWSVLLITTWSYQSFFFFVNSTELCFELQSTNDGGMDTTKQSDAFISCDNHNGTIASGKVTSLLFPILIVHMSRELGLNFPYIQSFFTTYEWYCKQK